MLTLLDAFALPGASQLLEFQRLNRHNFEKGFDYTRELSRHA
jgi:hypothetical protein